MIGLAHFIEIKQAAGTRVYAWQNHWPGQTVDGHTFYPFTLGEISGSSNGADGAVSLALPPTAEALALADGGIPGAYLAVVTSYSYLPATPTAKTRVAGYYGQIVGATVTPEQVELEIGCAVDAVEAQVPARIFTTTLVGTPPKR
jgi:hypothetical protein